LVHITTLISHGLMGSPYFGYFDMARVLRGTCLLSLYFGM
jgi:hypothetical protein